MQCSFNKGLLCGAAPREMKENRGGNESRRKVQNQIPDGGMTEGGRKMGGREMGENENVTRSI